MFQWAIYAMIFVGIALMVYNIYGFVRYVRYIHMIRTWQTGNGLLYLPVILLVLFLLGYIIVGVFGSPDLVVAGILFGGSVFVCIMYRYLNSITQRIVASERLKSEVRTLEESNRARNNFLSSISHEMRTPMNVILGLDRMALKNPDLPPKTRDQLERIDRSAKHLLSLINNMLDLRRIETGKLVIHSEPFSMKETLDEINAILTSLCDEKGLDCEITFDEGALRHYMGDAVHLRRALLCLLENAVKYTDSPGKVSFHVERLVSDDETDTLRFTVKDTGVGIDPAFLDQVFELFSQEDASATNRFGGSGMGLTVANSVISRMGGTIGVTSEKHEGATFTVTLPLTIAVIAVAEETEHTPKTLQGFRVLLVEDIDENAEIVSDLLELEGVTSERAVNGQVAVEMLQSAAPRHFDAVLMDLRMPVMGGIEATKKLRALDHPDAKSIPIIALTANAFESDVQQCLDAGMNAHLAKPVDPDKLYDTLREWIYNNTPTAKEVAQ